MKLKNLLIGCMSILILGATACRKYYNPPAVFETYDKPVDSVVTSKVLVISIDGVPGSVMKAIMPPTISSLLPNSKYTWTGLSEPRTDDPSTWSSIATGVRIGKHLIQDDTFLPVRDVNNPNTNPPFYPTIFYRILTGSPALKTLTISSWSQLNDRLFIHADTRVTTVNDLASKDTAVKRLQSSNAALTLVNFREVETVGAQSGFSATNPGFVTAVKTADGYVAEMLAALKQRKSYNKEKWLVIITTNHGASGTSYGGSSDAERNIFAVFYNPKYKQLELNGKTLYTEHFKSGVVATANDPNGIYNIGSGAITLQGKIKINPAPDGTYNFGGNYILLIGKNRWGVYRQRNVLSIYLADDSGNRTQLDVDNTFTDGLWHSFAVVISTDNVKSSRTIKTYIDGALMGSKLDQYSSGTITDPRPLQIGGNNDYSARDAIDFNIEDIRISNKALTDGDIANDACSIAAESGSASYKNLIGYWPAQDGLVTLKNAIAGQPDFTITGTSEFANSPNTLPCNLGADNVTVENITIVPQIYYWLGISIDQTWALDGRVFLSSFATELQ
ncbi:alkaline phosphatase family protein [Mucilaginibacter sp. SMC90]|uniref:LamG-like jellyroll fold domain-containing protein n=1 Tax=Mucilaginibacter sp. SMC90 TaxID=2929803 RepID=UPI001FB4ABBC|nr:LamG-like jellyroll fold domain-containing protein [Mucilaginibacter sp. SMC90]UOE47783.1 alkaline phosphatase family protein [Mucilaginibacter sp. SMC90]